MTRAALLAAVVLAAHATAQPTPTPATYTASPDLKPPTESVRRDGRTHRVTDFKALHTHLRDAAEEELRPTASPAARVRSFQLQSGLDLLARTLPFRGTIARGFPLENELQELTRAANDTYRAAAGGESDPDLRRGMLREWVQVLKHLEQQTELRVNVSLDAPDDLSYIRFHRLGAEAALLAAE